MQNRQIERTKSWVADALFELLNAKNYSEIIVADILKRAGIARGTFYRYYKNKDDVVMQYFINIFKPEYDPEIDTLFDFADQDVLCVNLSDVNFNQNAVKMKILLSSDAEPIFFKQGQTWEKHVIKHFEDKILPIDVDFFKYAASYKMNGSLRIISNWIKTGLNNTTKDVDIMLSALCVPNMQRSIPTLVLRV